MTESEVSKLIFVLKRAYPKYYKNMTEDEMQGTVDVWRMILEDYTYEQASLGLRTSLSNDKNGFPPSPGQVIDCIHKVMEKPSMTALEAWSQVYKAICRANYYAEEEFAKLPPESQRAIGSANNLKEMAQMPTETVLSVEQSHFIRSYNAEVKRMADERKTPTAVRIAVMDGAELPQKGKLVMEAIECTKGRE